LSGDSLCEIAFVVERGSQFYLGAMSDALGHIRIVLVVLFLLFLLQCLAVLALAVFFLSSVVPGAVSDQRNQDCGSAFAPEGSLPIESQSRFLFFHELNGF
jgi:Na+/H+-translocating membrane pyrophosphatase